MAENSMRWVSARKLGLAVLGLVLALALIEITLRVGGRVFVWRQARGNRMSLRADDTRRVLCLGESTTAVGGKHSYPRQLEAILNENSPEVEFAVVNRGVPGVDTDHILSELRQNLDTYRPHVVVTMMGINDEGHELVFAPSATRRTFPLLPSLRVFRLFGVLRRRLGGGRPPVDGGAGRAPSVASPDFQMPRNAARQVDKGNPPGLSLLDRHAPKLKSIAEGNAVPPALDAHPDREKAYVELGWYRASQGDYIQAEEIMRNGIERSPSNDVLYAELGWMFMVKGEYARAEGMFRKAARIRPEQCVLFGELSSFYVRRGEHQKAENLLQEAVNLSPMIADSYLQLGWFYMERKQYEQAELAIRQATGLGPVLQYRAHAALARCYEAWGRPQSARAAQNKADEIGALLENPRTRCNYRELRRTVCERGIRLVCVGYPMRSAERLREMLAPCDDVIIVDNRQVFREAVKKEGHAEYFCDLFAGDFGHCTPRGNHLLARNVANAVLRACSGGARGGDSHHGLCPSSGRRLVAPTLPRNPGRAGATSPREDVRDAMLRTAAHGERF